MTKKFIAFFGLFVLLTAPAFAQSTTAEPLSDTVDSDDRRLSNQELRTRIFALEGNSEKQQEEIVQLKISLAESLSELQHVKESHQLYETETAVTLTSLREERLESEEIIRSQISRFADELASEKSDRIASQEALTGEISSIAKNVAAGDVRTSGIAEMANDNTKSLDLLRDRLSLSERNISEQGELLNGKFLDISDAVSLQTIVGSTAVVLFGLVVFFLGRRLVVNRRQLIGQISKSSESIRNDYDDLDLKLSALLEQQLSRLPSDVDNDSTDSEPDHSLPLQVAAEVHRMSTRLKIMPPNTKGVLPLTRALERLVDGLESNGYEIVSLVGEKYNEGMTIKSNFVLDDEMAPGDQIISKVIKPQVNYKGAIVQVADVEVSFGE